jgi:hypothetical protein
VQKHSDGTITYNDRSSSGYGVVNAISWETSGGGLAAFDPDGDGQKDLFCMGINKITDANDEFRVRIASDVYQTQWQPPSFEDRSGWDFPPPSYCGIFSCPSYEVTGGGIAAHDIDGNGTPELIFMDIDNNPSSANQFRYTIAWNVTRPSYEPFSLTSYSTPSFPGSGQGATVGWETAGGGVDVGDIDNDGTNEIVFLGVESTLNTPRFIIYKIDIGGNVEGGWRPFIEVPLDATYSLGGGSLSLADIDNDGDLDMIVMGVEQNPGDDTYRIRFGINGRNSSSNNPFAKAQRLVQKGQTKTKEQTW